MSFSQDLRLNAFQHLARNGRALFDKNLAVRCQVCGEFSAFKKLVDSSISLLTQNAYLVFKVAAQAILFRLLDCERARVFLLPLSCEDLNVNDRPVNARRTDEASVFHVACFFAEDGAKKFLFGCKLRLAFRRDLAYED